MKKLDNDRSMRKTGLRRCNDANPTRVGLSRPGLAWQTSSLARSLVRETRACTYAVLHVRACISDCHVCVRVTAVHHGSQRRNGWGTTKEVVSRGWTAYLLGTISLSGGSAHAYTYARDARENRRTDTRGERDLDLTFDPRDSYRSAATSPMCYFGRL